MKKDKAKAKAFYRQIRIDHIDKTEERLQFEETHTCFLGVMRPSFDGALIDRWYQVPKGRSNSEIDEISSASNSFNMMARFNNAKAFGIWLPNELVLKQEFDPNQHIELIKKYMFKI